MQSTIVYTIVAMETAMARTAAGASGDARARTRKRAKEREGKVRRASRRRRRRRRSGRRRRRAVIGSERRGASERKTRRRPDSRRCPRSGHQADRRALGRLVYRPTDKEPKQYTGKRDTHRHRDEERAGGTRESRSCYREPRGIDAQQRAQYARRIRPGPGIPPGYIVPIAKRSPPS